ncbi:MAG: hypothetical protein DSY55_00165 [Clostridia bacterium]|nr:MAG: hypothetical protein DSY55_00165 [Clostridia bacterium]
MYFNLDAAFMLFYVISTSAARHVLGKAKGGKEVQVVTPETLKVSQTFKVWPRRQGRKAFLLLFLRDFAAFA